MMALIAFLGSPFGKIVGWIVGALLLAGIATGGYFLWKNQVENRVLYEYNLKQAEQAAKDRAEFIEKIKEITIAQEEILEQLRQKNQESNALKDSIDEYLQSEEANQYDRPSSEILKETIRRLSGEK